MRNGFLIFGFFDFLIHLFLGFLWEDDFVKGPLMGKVCFFLPSPMPDTQCNERIENVIEQRYGCKPRPHSPVKWFSHQVSTINEDPKTRAKPVCSPPGDWAVAFSHLSSPGWPPTFYSPSVSSPNSPWVERGWRIGLIFSWLSQQRCSPPDPCQVFEFFWFQFKLLVFILCVEFLSIIVGLNYIQCMVFTFPNYCMPFSPAPIHGPNPGRPSSLFIAICSVLRRIFSDSMKYNFSSPQPLWPSAVFSSVQSEVPGWKDFCLYFALIKIFFIENLFDTTIVFAADIFIWENTTTGSYLPPQQWIQKPTILLKSTISKSLCCVSILASFAYIVLSSTHKESWLNRNSYF